MRRKPKNNGLLRCDRVYEYSLKRVRKLDNVTSKNKYICELQFDLINFINDSTLKFTYKNLSSVCFMTKEYL